MAQTSIAWTEKVWNPVRGCAKVSDGCKNCYAERMAVRFSGPGQPYEGLVLDGNWTGEARFIPEMLSAPLRWKKPSLIFVNSMSDLFHDDVTFEQIAAVYGIIAACPEHTFQVLTKRTERMAEFYEWANETECGEAAASLMGDQFSSYSYGACSGVWPLPNLHLGVSVEDQRAADARVPLLLQCPAAVRWVSCEPLLGSVNLTHLDADAARNRDLCQVNCLTGRHTDMGRPCPDVTRVDWIVCGGESGPNARPMHPDWARALRDQCKEAHVPFFFKQWGEWGEVTLRPGLDLGGEMRKGNVQIVHAPGNPEGHFRRGDVFMRRVGKRAAGNLLDGVRYEMRPGDKW
jgi:protein gp37